MANEDNACVKSEPIVMEEEHPFDENATPNDTEEKTHRFALDDGEIDHDMLIDGMQFECVSICSESIGLFICC